MYYGNIFGEIRFSSGNTPTNYQYTGQLNQPEIGLSWYASRFYDPYLAHFVQPDSIIPGLDGKNVPGSGIAWDRFNYTGNNPIRFNDPDGHTSCEECDGGGGEEAPLILPPPGSNGGDPPRGSPWAPSVSDSSDGSTTEGDTSNNAAIILGGNTSEASIDSSSDAGVINNIDENAASFASSSDAGVNNVYTENTESIELSSDAGANIFPRNEPGKEDNSSSELANNWKLGNYKSVQKWANQMIQRGWTADQITEALQYGEKYPAINNINPNNPATRYINPTTGRSVVIDDVTQEIIHIGGDGFEY
ncbi:MAG: RHS repeat-associated core domain-containing protein [Anaerolineaceae bacterium]|nr:RHS repeat-associated core domain-containing protein [Anaerolineaceae bacterium]